MAIEVFKRSEKKYVIDNDTFLSMREFLKQYMTPDKYNVDNQVYSINNLYYDTKDDYLIRTSIDKPRYKEKLRVRSYGVPKCDSIVFIELKKKFDSITYKRRTKIVLEDAYNFIENKKMPENTDLINYQVLNELNYFINLYNPIPKMKICYERYAFFSNESKDLRVSFDRNIFYNNKDIRLENDDKGTRLLKENFWVLEIKGEKGVPLWLARYLSENKIFSTGFSKYGSSHKKLITISEEDYQWLLQEQEPLLAKSLQ